MSDVNIIDGKEYTNEEAHRLLWNWLADNPHLSKLDFFDAHQTKTIPDCYCYACKECNMECMKCPIKWVNLMHSDVPCSDSETIYTKWRFEKDLEKASSISRQIANMEWTSKREVD